MDLPSNLYHDTDCMGLVLYASFSLHRDPNFILSHLNSGKSHSLDCQCQMSMANIDDQTIAFCTSKEEVTWLLELGEFIWMSYVPGEPFKNMLQQCSRTEASFVSDWPGVKSLEILVLSGCKGQPPNASYFLGLIPTLSSIGTTLTLPYTDRSRKKKKKKTQAINHDKWKSEAQQQIDSSKLLQTLSQVHLSPPPPSATATRRGRAVCEAADQHLQQQEDDKNHDKWKSKAQQQQIYSCKLLQTHSQVHLSPPPPSSTATATRRGRAVREAADQLLQQQEDDKNHNKWKSEAQQQQIYSFELLQTPGQVRLSPPPSSAASLATRRGQVVREIADRVLAVAAKGKTRRSRAILTKLLKLKFLKKHRQQQRVVSATRTSRWPKKPKVSVWRLKRKSILAVKRKVRVLVRLVPNYRKQPLPVILDKATNYIAALEMEVRALTIVANLLSGSTSSSSSPSSASSSSVPPPS